MLRSDLCDYSYAYVVVKERISVKDTNNANTRNKNLAFKINAPLRSCISKINKAFNYSMISGSLWNYYRDEVNDDANKK